MGAWTTFNRRPCDCGGKAEIYTARVAEDAEEAWVSCASCGLETERIEDAYADRIGAAADWNAKRDLRGGFASPAPKGET
ncbi:MAG TPA: hypothetical protein VGN75_12245 [Kaistia sp.]|jgi:transcription elongation factor Elf1|nr:hypothetical protein [Kaistia sp.]